LVYIPLGRSAVGDNRLNLGLDAVESDNIPAVPLPRSDIVSPIARMRTRRLQGFGSKLHKNRIHYVKRLLRSLPKRPLLP
jgi:hypothetical protein